MEIACFSCGRIFNDYGKPVIICPECQDRRIDIFEPCVDPIEWEEE